MQVYLDYNSTTPVDPRVMDAMMPYFRENYGNPSSGHALGAISAKAISIARLKVAELIGAAETQVIFCSSATEAINTALRAARGKRLVISAVEHAATLESAERLRESGGELVTLSVDAHGDLDLNGLRRLLGRCPTMVSLIWANNETGVMFPIGVIAEMCAEHGALLHVDAVQMAGKEEIDFGQLPIDFLSISSHKIFGPKGIAALVARDPGSVSPLLYGGGQEKGLRAGTENVPAIVGFGEAAHLAKSERLERMRHAGGLRDRLEQELLTRVQGTWLNGGASRRIANTLSMGFAGVDGDDFVGVLDGLGIAASTGSACHSKSMEPSHVLMAMTKSRVRASQSVRFSLSHLNTREEIDYCIDAICSARAGL